MTRKIRTYGADSRICQPTALLLGPDEVVFIGSIAIGVEAYGRNSINGLVVATPTQREIGNRFITGLRDWEWMATDPVCACFLDDNVTVGIERGFALVRNCRIEIVWGIHLFDVGVGFLDEESTTVLLYFLIQNRVDQILYYVDVIGIDSVTDFNFAFCISLDVIQLFRVDLADVTRLTNLRPQRREHSGSAQSERSFLHKMSAAIVEIVFFNMHSVAPSSLAPASRRLGNYNQSIRIVCS